MKISQLDHLRVNKFVRFKEEAVDGETFTIVSYIIADNAFWALPNAKETRGITFNSNGDCVCRPFEKFFNLNENEETFENTLHMHDMVAVEEKIDGSMITPVLVNGKVRLKTKKSFYSDVALAASECTKGDDTFNRFCVSALGAGFTPIFEFNHKNHIIVIDYGVEYRLTLLALRNIETGEYLPRTDPLWKEYPLHSKVYGFHGALFIDWKNAAQFVAENEKMEGFVIQFRRNGELLRVKLKTEWYRTLHLILTDMSERKVALSVAEEKFDDLVSLAVSRGVDVTKMRLVEKKVLDQFVEMRTNTENLFQEFGTMDRPTIGKTFSSLPFFPLAMSLYNNKEPDYVGYWKRNSMKQEFSTNNVFGVAED